MGNKEFLMSNKEIQEKLLELNEEAARCQGDIAIARLVYFRVSEWKKLILRKRDKGEYLLLYYLD